ncbi:MAG: hypothetical protein PHT32_04705, partial [Candidatus Omnitrophica bacterium]|nr:hypothetical protein [Candidatus Omnitrophota bacterium]
LPAVMRGGKIKKRDEVTGQRQWFDLKDDINGDGKVNAQDGITINDVDDAYLKATSVAGVYTVAGDVMGSAKMTSTPGYYTTDIEVAGSVPQFGSYTLGSVFTSLPGIQPYAIGPGYIGKLVGGYYVGATGPGGESYLPQYQTGIYSTQAEKIVQDYFAYETAKDQQLADFVYDYDAQGNRKVRDLFTCDLETIIKYATVSGDYTYDMVAQYGQWFTTAEVQDHRGIKEYIERARAAYKYVMEQKKAKAQTAFMQNLNNANAAAVRVAGMEHKPQPLNAQYGRNQLLDAIDLMGDENLKKYVLGLEAGTMVTSAFPPPGFISWEWYANELLKWCDNPILMPSVAPAPTTSPTVPTPPYPPSPTGPPLTGMPEDVWLATMGIQGDTLHDIRIRLLALMTDQNVPVWQPGAFNYNLEDTSTAQEPTEEQQKLIAWCISQGRYSTYTAGLVDQNERSIDNAVNLFITNREKLAWDTYKKQLAIEGIITDNIDSTYGLPVSTVFPDGLSAETYLTKYILEFWKSGVMTETLLGASGKKEAETVESYSLECIDFLDKLLKEQKINGKKVANYNKALLERLPEIKAKMEVILNATRAFDPQDNQKVWEGDFEGTGQNQWKLYIKDLVRYATVTGVYSSINATVSGTTWAVTHKPGTDTTTITLGGPYLITELATCVGGYTTTVSLAPSNSSVDIAKGEVTVQVGTKVLVISIADIGTPKVRVTQIAEAAIPNKTNLSFYTDYGQQKTNLAAMTMQSWIEMAFSSIQQIDNIYISSGSKELVANLVEQIEGYAPQYRLTTQEEKELRDVVVHNANFPWDLWTEPYRFIEIPYIQVVDPNTHKVVDIQFKYKSLEEWRQDILKSLRYKHSLETGKVTLERKDDITYTLFEDIRSPAQYVQQAAKEKAQMERQTKMADINSQFANFERNVYQPAKAEFLKYTDDKQWSLVTEKATLTPAQVSTTSGGVPTGGALSLVEDPVSHAKKRYSFYFYYDTDTNSKVERMEIAIGMSTYVVGLEAGTNRFYFTIDNGQSYDKYYLTVVSHDQLNDQEKAEVGEKKHIGKFYDVNYMQETYYTPVTVERSWLDHNEEADYRQYASVIGMGGVKLAKLYRDIEILYADRLSSLASSYYTGWITDQQFEENLDTLYRERENWRASIEDYFLGTCEKFDLSRFETIKGHPEYADRLYGILKDLTLYMSEEEKRAFIKGQELTRLVMVYDSIFDIMVDQYRAAVFYKRYIEDRVILLNDTPVQDPLSLALTNPQPPIHFADMQHQHTEYIGVYLTKFCVIENTQWNTYITKTQTNVSSYRQYVQKMIDLVYTVPGEGRIDDIFDWESWVPGNTTSGTMMNDKQSGNYNSFRDAATPGLQSNPAQIIRGGNTYAGQNAALTAEILGQITFENMQKFMTQVGFNVFIEWLIQNSFWKMTMPELGSESVRQDAVDRAFYDYSNLMEKIIQYMTCFTDYAGLTYDVTEPYRAWWMTGFLHGVRNPDVTDPMAPNYYLRVEADGYGPKYHLENYAYSNVLSGSGWPQTYLTHNTDGSSVDNLYGENKMIDNRVRDADMGRRMIEAMTQTAFSEDPAMYLDAQKMLAEILGQDVGEYKYKEFGYQLEGTSAAVSRAGELVIPTGSTSTTAIYGADSGSYTTSIIPYGLSVVGEDRYHSIPASGRQSQAQSCGGTYNKKMYEISNKAFLSDKEVDPNGAFRIQGAYSISSSSGSLVREYNKNVYTASSALLSAVYASCTAADGQIRTMSIKERSSSTSAWTAIDALWPIIDNPRGNGFDSGVDFESLNVLGVFKAQINSFKSTVHMADTTFRKELFKLMAFQADTTGASTAYTGAYAKVEQQSWAIRERTTDNLFDDLFHLKNNGVKMFRSTVQDAIDIMENGMPGSQSNFTDALNGTNVDGRRQEVAYAYRKFADYFIPDIRKFTEQNATDLWATLGMESMKALNIHYQRKDGSLTTLEESFLSTLDVQKRQPYEVTDLTAGVTEQYVRGKDQKMKLAKRFGAGEFWYEFDLYANLVSWDFVYNKGVRNELITDRQGFMGADGRYIHSDNSIRNMREPAEWGMPREIRAYDDARMLYVTNFSRLFDVNNLVWKRFAYTQDENEGYTIDRMYDAAGLRNYLLQGALRFGDMRSSPS